MQHNEVVQLKGNQLENDLKTAFQLVLEALRRGQSFVLTTHREPDGDGLGAEAALAEALIQMGKDVQVVNNDPVPGHYEFLHGSQAFQTYRESQHRDLLATTDAVILLDAARPERTGRLAEALARRTGTTISIDHHLDGGWAQLDLIDASACATTELVHDLIQKLPVALTPTMAEALYAGIAADTLVFRTAHTTPGVHRRSAQLMEAGASIERVHQALFSSWPLGRLRLLGDFFRGLHTDVAGRLIWGIMGPGDLARYNLGSADVEGFVEEELTVAGTDLAVLFLEESGDTIRISLRSRNGIRVDGLARSLGGGGHAQAAGARLSGPLEQAVPRALEAARAILGNQSL